MHQTRRMTAIIEREDDGFVAHSLFFDVADASEIARRLHDDVFVTQVEVPVG
jgi:hypothetical protein